MKAVKGDDYQNKGHDHKTFGITVTDAWTDLRGKPQPHGNMVEVYRTEAVRDRILTLLQRHGFVDGENPGVGFAVLAPEGWVGIWKDRGTAELMVSKVKGSRLVEMVESSAPSAGETSCDKQLAEAQRLAANLGYMVVPDPVHADGEVHAPDFVMAMQPSLRALGFHAVPIATPPAPSGEVVAETTIRAALAPWWKKVCELTDMPGIPASIAGDELVAIVTALSNPAPGHEP